MGKRAIKCLHCGRKVIVESAKRVFCSDRCRVYYNRSKDQTKVPEPNKKPSQVEKKVDMLERKKQVLEDKPTSIADLLREAEQEIHYKSQKQ